MARRTKSRRLQIESLERRELLSISAAWEPDLAAIAGPASNPAGAHAAYAAAAIAANVSVGSISGVVAGQSVTIPFTVTNTGSTTRSFGVGAEIWLNGTLKAGLGAKTTVSLAPGKSWSGSYTWTVPSTWPSGTYTARVAVWSGTPGSSTWLGSYDRGFGITAQSTAAGITVSSISTAVAGDAITISFTVTNRSNYDRSFGVGSEIYQGSVKTANVGTATTPVVARNGGTYSGSFTYRTPSTWGGSYTVRAAVWTGTPGSSTWLGSYDRAFSVTAVGAVQALLQNVDGSNSPASGTQFILYTSPKRTSTSGNPVTFANVPLGNYWLEGYQTGTFFGREYWGSRQVTVTAGTVNTTLRRYEPFVQEVHVYNGNTEVMPGQPVAPGTVLRAEVTVRNNYSGALQSQVHLVSDNDPRSTYEIDQTSLWQRVPGGGTSKFVFNITPGETGQYSYAVEVKTVLETGNTDRTDSRPWATTFVAARPVVPVLESRPGAHAKIYLDFDGDAATTWRNDDGVYHVPLTPAYDTDGNRLAFSAQELSDIRRIWSWVAEKFSPFDINVTTVDPGNMNDLETEKVIIGGHVTDWYQPPPQIVDAGAVSAIGGFYNDLSNSCYVFAADAPGDVHYLGETVAHEVGHAFGLRHERFFHDGILEKYYKGDADRAPIMGGSSVNQTARGLWWLTNQAAPQYSPDHVQDELAVLASDTDGFHYRADDHGNSAGAADSLSGSDAGWNAHGVIEQAADADYFSFTTAGGAVAFTVRVADYGAMLDPALEIRNADGSLIVSADASVTSESVSATLAAGSYRLVVRSHGDYGDIGQYSVVGRRTQTPVVDQSNLPTWQGGWTNMVPGNRVGQTFLPALPILTGVDIGIVVANAGSGSDTLTLDITQGSRTLASIAQVVPAGYSGLLHFELPVGVAVTPGSACTLWVHDTGKVAFGWKYAGDTYAPGTRLFGGLPASGDFFFRTYGTGAGGSQAAAIAPDAIDAALLSMYHRSGSDRSKQRSAWELLHAQAVDALGLI